MSKSIINPTKKQLGKLRGIIYGIHNKTNGKWYVGQTVNTFVMRYGEQPWKTGVFNRHLRSSINKHGWHSFEIVLLEHGITDIVELNRLEHEHAVRLKSYEPFGYNVKSCGNGQGPATPAMRRIASVNAATKEWVFKHVESGEVIRLKNLSEFTREKGLSRTRLGKVIKDGKGIYRGYSALSATVADHVNKRIYTIHPNMPKAPYTLWRKGEKYVFDDIKAFMRQQGLIDAQAFYAFLEGKVTAYKGYTHEPKDIIWPTRRYYDIRLIDTKGIIFVCNGIRDCVKVTGTKVGPIYQMLYGNRLEVDGYRLLDFKKGVPNNKLVVL